MTSKRIGTSVLVVLLAVEFLLAGASKVRPSSAWVRMFAAWGFPGWFRVAVGATEIVCALALFFPRARFPAAAMLVVLMAGAAVTHLTHGEAPRVILNIVLTVMLGTLMALDRKRSTSPPRARQN